MRQSDSSRGHGVRFAVIAVALFGLLALGAAAAPTAQRAPVTLTFLGSLTGQPTYSAVIQNFERVHPNITIETTYAPTAAQLSQLVTTELAAGTAPDLFPTYPGCGTQISICKLAKAGYLAPMVGKAWAKSLDPRVLRYSKLGPTLYAFLPSVVFDGLLTNDTMLKTLGLKVPRTFAQLLTFCHKAKAAGTTPLMLTALGSNTLQQLIADISLTTVYAKDKQWGRKLQAGKVTFYGTPGWHQALQEIVDMNDAAASSRGRRGRPARPGTRSSPRGGS